MKTGAVERRRPGGGGGGWRRGDARPAAAASTAVAARSSAAVEPLPCSSGGASRCSVRVAPSRAPARVSHIIL